MQSKTYANEVDVRNLKKGLTVSVGFDAFPEISMKGEVLEVANVGENKKGSDIKIFSVLIDLKESNENIRPGMTTSNKILTHEEKDALLIPIEAIFAKDSISYVYKKTGFKIEKKQVLIGNSNNTEVIILKGLQEKDAVYLNKPEGYEEQVIIPLKS